MAITTATQLVNRYNSAPLQSEVVVIGASLAGLFTAYLLARQGKQVHLFEAGDLTRFQSRTLIATAQLEEALGFFPAEAVVNRVTTMELIAASKAVNVGLRKPDLIVERAAMLRLLVRRAEDAGVALWPHHRFLGFAPTSDGLKLSIENKLDKNKRQVTTKILVGADGAVSRVAGVAGIAHYPRVPLLQAIVEPRGGCDPTNVRVWFEPGQTGYFYWSIPENEKRSAVGLIADEASTAKDRLLNFLSMRNWRPLAIQAARVPLSVAGRKPWKHIAGSDVYLVGDAAGHVKVTTVGGLVTGLRGAQAAAQTIENRSNYGKTLRSLDRELWLHELIRRTLNGFSQRDYRQLLDCIDDATALLLGRYSRDELTKLALKLAITQPRLLGFARHLIMPASNRRFHSLPSAETADGISSALPPTTTPLPFEE
jgi:flavin-dependent dehydrogenase